MVDVLLYRINRVPVRNYIKARFTGLRHALLDTSQMHWSPRQSERVVGSTDRALVLVLRGDYFSAGLPSPVGPSLVGMMTRWR